MVNILEKIIDFEKMLVKKNDIELIKDTLNQYTDSVTIDDFSNIIAVKKGESKKKIIISSKCDEAGFRVEDIVEGGFIKIVKAGVIDVKSFLLSDVIIYGKKNIKGVIISRPARKIKREFRNEIFIYTGLDESYLRDIISIGDFVGIKMKPFYLRKNEFLCNVKTNLCNSALLMDISQKVYKERYNYELFLAAEAQEMFRGNGAYICAKKVKPDLAIIIGKISGLYQSNRTFENIGKGPILCISPYLNRRYYQMLSDIAKKNNIPYQVLAYGSIMEKENEIQQISSLGIPTVFIGVPMKYKDTSLQTIYIKDLEFIEKLVISFLEEISTAWLLEEKYEDDKRIN